MVCFHHPRQSTFTTSNASNIMIFMLCVDYILCPDYLSKRREYWGFHASILFFTHTHSHKYVIPVMAELWRGKISPQAMAAKMQQAADKAMPILAGLRAIFSKSDSKRCVYMQEPLRMQHRV